MTDHNQWEKEMSSDFNATMDGIRSEPVPSDSLERSLRAAEEIVMTKSAYKRGYLNTFICSMIIWPIGYLMAVGIDRVFNVGTLLALMGMGAGFSAIAFSLMMGQMVLGRARRGKVLLDCGPFPMRKNARMMASLMFTAAFIGALVATGTFGKVVAIFLAAFGLYWVIVSRGRLLVCENGVFLYWSLLRWDQIKSYRWEGDTDATLMIQTTNPFPMLGRGALPVAIEQKKAVDALLQKYHTKK